MTFTKSPRLLARIAGVFYLIITACAMFAYMYVRGQVIIPGDMAQTATPGRLETTKTLFSPRELARC